jgi:hypothetical protein
VSTTQEKNRGPMGGGSEFSRDFLTGRREYGNKRTEYDGRIRITDITTFIFYLITTHLSPPRFAFLKQQS